MALTLVTDKGESAAAFAKLETVLKRGADPVPLTLSTQGGHVPAQYVYWHAYLDMWAFPSIPRDGTRYWCAYGVVDPKKDHRQSPVLLVNPPIEGESASCQGAFAKDEQGQVHYLHGGKIGGGGKNVGKESFVGSGAWAGSGVSVVGPRGKPREMFDLGRLDSSGFLRSLADYVHKVERFKFAHDRVDCTVDERNRKPAAVFVSHSSQDSEWCREFVDRLTRAHVDVWYDDDRISVGKLTEQLERQIELRPAFVVVMSRSAVASKFVQHEVRTAIELAEQEPHRIVMPILAAKCDVPREWAEYVYLRNQGDAPLSPAQAASKALEMLTRPDHLQSGG